MSNYTQMGARLAAIIVVGFMAVFGTIEFYESSQNRQYSEQEAAWRCNIEAQTLDVIVKKSYITNGVQVLELRNHIDNRNGKAELRFGGPGEEGVCYELKGTEKRAAFDKELQNRCNVGEFECN